MPGGADRSRRVATKAARGARGMRERSMQEVLKEGSQVAAKIRAKLAERIGPERYGLWFGAHTDLVVEGDCLTVRVPSTFVRDCLRQNYYEDLCASVAATTGRGLLIEFEIEPTLLLNTPRTESGAAAHTTEREQVDSRGGGEQAPATSLARCGSSTQKGRSSTLSRRRMRQKCLVGYEEEPHLNSAAAREIVAPCSAPRPKNGTGVSPPEMSLDRFVVGPSNEYAFRTAELTARGRQQASPVIFYGATGVGKTHLLRAMQFEYRRRFPRARAVYLSAEQFTTAFVEALRGGGLPSFRQKFRDADLLIIDDLQFFVGKRRTIEELQHTVDAITQVGRQLVLSCDRTLAELQGLGGELISRLVGGLSCEIALPEFATRVRILRDLCDEMDLALNEDVLALVATRINSGARELRGTLYRLEAMSYAHGKAISREMADEALSELKRQNTPTVGLHDVQQAVCDVFGLEATQLRSNRKGRAFSEPRMLAMWLARKYTRSAWSDIGEFFGRRSHSTVISAHQRVEKMIAAQAEVGIDSRACSIEEAIRRVEAVLRTA